MMKAIVLEAPGDPTALQIKEIAKPSPRSEWVLIKVKAFGLFAGCLVMLYVFLEAPLSGFGMNPAHSFASAFPAQNWTAFWLYVLVPPLSMASASALYQYWFGRRAIKCAKLHHTNHKRCIFRCSYHQRQIDLSDRLLNS